MVFRFGSVSYTHLDVYKRQLMTFSENKEDVNETRFMIYNPDASETEKKNYIKNQIVKFKNLQRKMSVSYTHLDVYKRQVQGTCAEFLSFGVKEEAKISNNYFVFPDKPTFEYRCV